MNHQPSNTGRTVANQQQVHFILCSSSLYLRRQFSRGNKGSYFPLPFFFIPVLKIMEVSSTIKTVICRVCNFEFGKKGKNGSLIICDACRRFYHRYKNRPNLSCKNGTSQCLDQQQITTNNGNHQPPGQGFKWRNMCASCRFEKCKNVLLKKGDQRHERIRERKRREKQREQSTSQFPRRRSSRLIELLNKFQQHQAKMQVEIDNLLATVRKSIHF